MRLLIFLCVALAVVWFAQRREWERNVPTARDLGATAAEILAGFQEGELVAISGPESAVADSSPSPRTESAVADSSPSPGTEFAVANSSVSVKSSRRKVARRDSFGAEAEVPSSVASREEFATADSGLRDGEEFAAANSGPRANSDPREIMSRLDRVMSLAAGRDR
jgi:hypothetical protein